MITVINEYTGMSADKPRKEIIVTESSELVDIEVGHGSIAYSIADGMLFVYDEENEVWADTEGNMAGGGGSDDGGSGEA